MDAGLLPMLAQGVARGLDGWLLALLTLLAFVVLERRCARPSHWSCAVRALGPLAAAAALAALTPNLFEPRNAATGAMEIPSREAAAAMAVVVTLVAHYGARALGFALVLGAAGAAWAVPRSTSVTAALTGLLIGAGTGVLVSTVAEYTLDARGGADRSGR